MNPLVQLCLNNSQYGAKKVFEILDQDERIDVEMVDCLSECTICAMGLFAICESEVIRASNADELLKKVMLFLEEEDYI